MWSLLLLWTVSAAPSKAVYPAQTIASAGVKRVEIRGVRGSLRLTGRKGSHFRLRVMHSQGSRFEDWNLSVERRGDTLVLDVSNSTFGRQWKAAVEREQWPEFDLELEGPSVPLNVAWREGRLHFRKWVEKVEASLLKGRVRVEHCGGDWNLQLVDSDLDVRRFVGRLRAKAEQGRFVAEQFEGHADLHWLHGQMELKQARSELSLETIDASVWLKKVAGPMRLTATGGAVDVVESQGHLTGRGESTKWHILASRQLELDVINTSGPVNVRGPFAGSVFLTSRSGEIRSPFAVHLDEGRRVVRGKGAVRGQGSVFIRTESGAISFSNAKTLTGL